MKTSKVTITDIAKHAGVSKTTVSRVINGKPEVDKATRDQVLKVIEETGFVPQASAIHLAGGKTNIIGLVVPSLTSPYSLTVIQGVADQIAETDYELMLFTTSLSRKNQDKYIKIISNKLTDGLIILLPRSTENFEGLLLQSKIPVVLIDHHGIDLKLSCITASNTKGAREAVEYLLGLGHKRIGFITGLMDFGCSRDRLEGYLEALAENHISSDPELIRYGDFSENSGYHAASDLLEIGEPPSAIFCSNDEMAFGVIEAINEKGLRVPEDISVVGFDDTIKSRYFKPALTSVKQPLHLMGTKAAEHIIQKINGLPIEKNDLVLDTELLIRSSCIKNKS